MLKRLYDKSETAFAILWIAAYVVLFSVADGLSSRLGIQKSITALVGTVFVALLVLWIKKHDLFSKYGLSKVKLDYKKYLYFIPLALICTVNFWHGINIKVSFEEIVLFILSMLAVGITEEIIFRGFLFRALCKEGIKTAVLFSSITFGLGHIINLLNGAEFASTLLQICCAIVIGFLFTVIFYKSGSLYPPIIAHALLNSLSVFAKEQGFQIIISVIVIVIALAYSWMILKKESK